MSMTSRERVRTALNFQEPDRVPIDLGGSNCTGVCVDAYVELVRYLGLDLGPPKVYEPFEMLARLDEPVRRLLHGDVIGLENPSMKFDLENRDWKPWRTQVGHDVMMPGNFHPQVDDAGNTYILDARGERTAIMVPGALYFDKVCPVGLSDEFVKMDPAVWRHSIGLYSDEHLRILEDDARRLHDETEYAVLGEFGRGGLGSTSKFAGHTFTDWLCLLVLDPQYCFSILQATAERAIENLELYFQAVGRYIDIVFHLSRRFRHAEGALFDPGIFAELYLPNYRRINDYVHAQGDIKTFFHSCGSVFDFIEHFIAAGVDIVNPLQITAAGMDPVKIKQKYGGRIVFWGGGVDTQTVLPHGRPDEVTEQVKQRLSIFAPGGGYVFNPVHCIQYGVPAENLLAAVNTAYTCGTYPIAI